MSKAASANLHVPTREGHASTVRVTIVGTTIQLPLALVPYDTPLAPRGIAIWHPAGTAVGSEAN